MKGSDVALRTGYVMLEEMKMTHVHVVGISGYKNQTISTMLIFFTLPCITF